MSTDWQYQLRITLDDERAEVARKGTLGDDLERLGDVLAKHNAALKCQYDAFAGYVAEAEKNGTDKYPLYEWTKATIENPLKKAKYTRSFTIYVDGDEVYDKAKADGLEADLKPLAGDGTIASLAKHDTNPANNPQPPKRYRR